MNVTIPNGVEATIILPDNSIYNATKGEKRFECDINQSIIAPYSIDTPIFEIFENENATNVLKEIVPNIYRSATGETIDTLYYTIRHYGKLYGLSQEIIDKCQEELSKIKVLNYTIPDEDIPTDTPTDDPTDEPTDKPTDKPTDDSSSPIIIKFNYLLIGLIIILNYL